MSANGSNVTLTVPTFESESRKDEKSNRSCIRDAVNITDGNGVS